MWLTAAWGDRAWIRHVDSNFDSKLAAEVFLRNKCKLWPLNPKDRWPKLGHSHENELSPSADSNPGSLITLPSSVRLGDQWFLT